MKGRTGMSPIVQTISRWIRGLLLLYGVYIVLYGHLSPGGGFCGGVLIATTFALVLVAQGRTSSLTVGWRRLAPKLQSIAALTFVGAAVVGLWHSGVFFHNFIETPAERWFTLNSSGAILITNAAVGLGVGSGLAMVVAALAAAPETSGPAPSDEEDGA